MYLLMGLDGSEIGASLSIPVKKVYDLIAREGWTKERERMKSKAVAKCDERAAREVENIVESVAIKTEELALGTLDAAGEVLENQSGDFWAKDLQSLSQAAKNFVSLARQARGLDSASGNLADKPQILFLQLERVERPEKKVEHIHELSTSEVTPLSSAKDNASPSPETLDEGGF